MAIPAILAALALGGANVAHESRTTRKETERRSVQADSVFKALGLDIPGQPRADGADLDPVRQRRLSGIHELLTSEDAATQTRGFNLAGGQTPTGKTMSAIMLEKEELAIEQNEVNLATSRHNLSSLRQDAEIRRDILHQTYATGEANLTAAAAGTPIDLKAPVPVRMNPWTKEPTVAYLPGTKEFNDLQAVTADTQGLTRDVNKLASMMRLAGSELWNTEVVGEMQALHASAVPRMSQLFGSGTPQAFEAEMYQDMLPDATAWSTNAATILGRKNEYMAAFAGLQRLMSRKLKSQAMLNPYQKVDMDTFHPAIVSPEERQFIESNRPDPGVYIRGR